MDFFQQNHKMTFKKKTENRNVQDGEGWLESGAADRVGSYF